MHEKLDEFNKLKNKSTIEFKNSYNRLLETIKKYKFKENSSKGFAAKQNRNSQLIIADLQMLNEKLNETLQYIDNFLVQNNSDENLEKKEHVFLMLNQYIASLDIKNTTLNASMYEYYDDSKNPNKENSAARVRYWKKERNSALSEILHISIGLLYIRNNLRILLHDSNDKFIKEYQNFMDYLITRPNYYSYFTTEEQREESENNRTIKRELKIKDRLKTKQ